MTAIALSVGVELIRVDAVDANAADTRQKIDRMQARGPVGHLGRGTLACTLSHGRAWATFLESDADSAVFLEDDVLLSNDFAEVVSKIQSNGHHGFDLIKIECGGSANSGLLLGRSLEEVNDRRLRPCHQLAVDAAAYMMTRRGAQKALEGLATCNVGVDHYLFYPIPRRGGASLPFAMIEPALALQDRSISSNIALHRHEGSTWLRRLLRLPYEVAPAGHMAAHYLFQGARVIRAPFRA